MKVFRMYVREVVDPYGLSGIIVKTSEEVYKCISKKLKAKPYESMYVLGIDNSGKIIGLMEVSSGSNGKTYVPARNVFESL